MNSKHRQMQGIIPTHTYIQWNLSIMDITGSVQIEEVSLFQRVFCTLLYVVGTAGSVLIREVSLFRRSLIERFHRKCLALFPLQTYTECLNYIYIHA